MHPTVREFIDEAERRHDVHPQVERFGDGTGTAAEAADAIGCDIAQIASSIVFVADGDVVVVVTSGAHRVDEDRVAEAMGAASVRMADPDEVNEATGWSVGGVPPICHENDLPVLFDETLLEFDTVWTAAGTPDTIWPVDPEHLRELADGKVVAVAE